MFFIILISDEAVVMKVTGTQRTAFTFTFMFAFIITFFHRLALKDGGEYEKGEEYNMKKKKKLKMMENKTRGRIRE